MDRDPLTGVPPSRHPLQIWILAACVLNGVFITLNVGEPPALAALLPEYALTFWGVLLLVVGVLGIAAAFWRDRITGLLVERIALAGLAGGTVVYAIAAVGFAGTGGMAVATFLLSVTIAARWRIRHIKKELQTLAKWREHAGQVQKIREEHRRLLEKGYGAVGDEPEGG